MRPRAGVALALVLMVLLLIEIMAAGMIALATQGRLVVAGQLRLARAETRALAGARAVLAEWDSTRHDTLPPLQLVGEPRGTGRAADVSWSTTVERLTTGMFLIRTSAEAGAGLAWSRARVVAVARTLDRNAALSTLNVAFASGGPAILAGRTRISAQESLPPGWSPESCAEVAEDLPSPAAVLAARTPVVGADVVIDGGMQVDATAFPNDSVALGGVRWSQLEAIADRIVSGTVSPGPPPGTDGACDRTAASNWGDPDRPAGPCADWFPLIFAPGDLHISGGRGQGILVVAGSLTLDGGARFTGAIVAGGGIIVADDVSLHGSTRSSDGPAVISDGVVRVSRCAVATALQRAPGTRRLILHDRTFIPPF